MVGFFFFLLTHWSQKIAGKILTLDQFPCLCLNKDESATGSDYTHYFNEGNDFGLTKNVILNVIKIRTLKYGEMLRHKREGGS